MEGLSALPERFAVLRLYAAFSYCISSLWLMWLNVSIYQYSQCWGDVKFISLLSLAHLSNL